MENLADRIRAYMKRGDLTAKDLGQRSGVEFRTIEGWLGSKAAMPRADSAVRVAQVLGTTVEFLVTGEAPRQVPPRLRALVDDLSALSEEELEPIRTLARSYASRHREAAAEGG